MSLPFFRLEQFIKEMAMKGVAKEALISMIKDKGAELRSSDGVTALYETDARYFPTDSMVKNIVGRAIRAQRLHAHDQPACEAFVKREQELKPDDKLSSYLATHWWPCAELWAACYRKAYHGGIDTNNHQEALNRALKYRFLNSRVSNEVYDGTCMCDGKLNESINCCT